MDAKILIVLIAIAGMVLFTGCTAVSGTTFADGLKKIDSIGAKYGVNTQTVVPVKETMYANYANELKQYRDSLKGEFQSNDVKALLLLIDVKLDLAEMQKNLDTGLSAVSGTMPNCPSAQKQFGEAKTKAGIIKQKVQLMESSYPIQAGKIAEFNDNVKAIAETVIGLEETIKSVCP